MTMKKSSKIWQKSGSEKLDPEVEKFEVGSDQLYDGKLFRYELASTRAHAKMLTSIGVLTTGELTRISSEIRSLYHKYGDEIVLKISDEDIHSKLENLLVLSLGDLGKKIHTGRSRNDQVITVMRLFEKEQILRTGLLVSDLIDVLLKFMKKEGEKVLPGYTHTKQAMLVNVKFWAASFIEALLDDQQVLTDTLKLIDSNPLGSGSGFGIPLPLDRKMTAELLGFSRVQLNPMAVQNSRGKYESLILDALWHIMNDCSRIAADLLTFNMDELLFVNTNASITTGSSIMPQKRNLDIMELVRARSRTMLSYSMNVKNIVSGMISGYNRDLQETKEPVFRAFDLVRDTIKVMSVTFRNIRFDEDAVKSHLSKGLFATDLAFQAVADGIPFRDAYRHAANKMENIAVDDETIDDSIDRRVSPGSPRTVSALRYDGLNRKNRSSFQGSLDSFSRKLKNLL